MGDLYCLRLTLHLVRVTRDSSTLGCMEPETPALGVGVTESDVLTCGCPCRALV